MDNTIRLKLALTGEKIFPYRELTNKSVFDKFYRHIIELNYNIRYSKNITIQNNTPMVNVNYYSYNSTILENILAQITSTDPNDFMENISENKSISEDMFLTKSAKSIQDALKNNIAYKESDIIRKLPEALPLEMVQHLQEEAKFHLYQSYYIIEVEVSQIHSKYKLGKFEDVIERLINSYNAKK